MKNNILILATITTVLLQNTPVYATECVIPPANTKEEILAEMEETYAPIFDELSKDIELYKEGRELLADEEFRTEFLQICYDYDEQPEVVLAVIYAESRFDPKAENGSCKGMMQINEKCHADRMERIGVTDLSDPLQNIRVGVDYLTELQSDGNGIKYALMVYNGDSKAKKSLKSGKYSYYANSIVEYAENIRAKIQKETP